jgi:hypothetical protein
MPESTTARPPQQNLGTSIVSRAAGDPAAGRGVAENPRAEAAAAADKIAVLERIRGALPPQYNNLQRDVPRAAFEELFPGIPYVAHGNADGRSTGIVSAFVPGAGGTQTGHPLHLATREWPQSKRNAPSKSFDVYGWSPNCAPALQNLLRLAREHIRFPVVVSFHEAHEKGARTRAWAGDDLAAMFARQVHATAQEGPPVVKGCKWGVWQGLPELPADHPRVGAGGYPVDAYVAHPDRDPKGRGYRKLVVSFKNLTFSDSDERDIAIWLTRQGWR